MEKNTEYWDNIWLQYHPINTKKIKRYFKIFDFYHVPHNAKIIDIGCGSGESLKVLKSHGFQDLQGLEPETRLFKNDLKTMVKEGSILDLKKLKTKYDVVLVFGVLHHLHNMEEIKLALRNIKGILKEGGTFYSVEQWKHIIRTVAMKLVRDTPVGLLHKNLRLERELLKLEQKELGHWLEVEKQVTKYAQEVGLQVIFAKKDLRYRYIIFKNV